MGNCFRTPMQDDISLLHGSETAADSNGSPSYMNVPQISPPCSHPADQNRVMVYHPSPNVTRAASQLTEEEQIKIAKRIGLIEHLPCGIYDGSTKAKECVICMGEFVVGDTLRYLPCVHIYHKNCIDDWLMRSFTCPSCMEPVDSALLMTYETN
ncbi:hypothetical protein HELRODRAFT_73705 [Helobdella robusta]|uniref:RING-type domain-containing protein n=1 Tax=Helobdella robusta TaxID=6412 RepID=T1G1H5_HELRO|nr:hypothetical protein HELRODRAFT_73705 [Helobdella robusta]ESO09278.1 hypothetical protein HELRODRAFT_73705 [Helobdella robusta]